MIKVFLSKAQTVRTLIIRAIIISTCCLILSALIPVLAYFGIFQPESEPIGSWFQRSGSIGVLFAAIAELFMNKIAPFVNAGGIVGESEIEWEKEFYTYYRNICILGGVLALVGTIIWGYGDLLI